MTDQETKPKCTEGEHYWVWDDHAGNPDSSEVYRLTGIKTAAWGHSGGISGSRICARCGMIEDWEARHGGERFSRWGTPNPERAEQLRELLP